MTSNILGLPAPEGCDAQATTTPLHHHATTPLPPPPPPPVITAAGIGTEPVRWLWRDVLAKGKITVVAGAANVGKSLLVAGDLAARVSAGTAWPDGSACPAADVLIASGHDGAKDTLVPRLLDHGADLQRVHLLGVGACRPERAAGPSALRTSRRSNIEPASEGSGGEDDCVEDREAQRPLLRVGLLPGLTQALRQRPSVNLVVIDPVSAFLDAGGKSARSRDVLAGIQELAHAYDTAIVLITHLCAASTRGAEALAGSDPLMSAARLAWLLTRDPEDRQRRLFMPAKNNLGDECAGYAWRMAGGKVRWETKRIERGSAGTRVDEAARSRGQREALATAFIADLLKAGPRMWVVIEHQGKLAGHRPGTLERVRGKVAETFKRHEADGRWLWRLIGDDRTSSQADIEDMFGGDPIGLVASGRSAKRAKARNDLDASGEDTDDDEDFDDDAE